MRYTILHTLPGRGLHVSDCSASRTHPSLRSTLDGGAIPSLHAMREREKRERGEGWVGREPAPNGHRFSLPQSTRKYVVWHHRPPRWYTNQFHAGELASTLRQARPFIRCSSWSAEPPPEYPANPRWDFCCVYSGGRAAPLIGCRSCRSHPLTRETGRVRNGRVWSPTPWSCPVELSGPSLPRHRSCSCPSTASAAKPDCSSQGIQVIVDRAAPRDMQRIRESHGPRLVVHGSWLLTQPHLSRPHSSLAASWEL